MRWKWLRALMLALVLGPAPADADDVESPDIEEFSVERARSNAVRGVNFYVWDEDSRVAADWARGFLRAGGETIEVAGWRAVAARAAARPSILRSRDDERAIEFAAWNEDSCGEFGISPLGYVLCLLPSVDRTCLISSWATSQNEQTRIVLARALSAPFEAVGVRAAIEHLQQDPSAEVRRLARSAMASRQRGRATVSGTGESSMSAPRSSTASEFEEFVS